MIESVGTITRRGLVAATIAVLPVVRAFANAEAANYPIIGRSVPQCTLTSVDATQSFALDKFAGKVLYVDFWASWCTPCLLSFPFMNQLQHTYAPRGLQIVAVNVDSKPADALRFLSRHPADFTVAAGTGPQCAKAFGVATMPTSFLIDRHGVVRGVHPGFRPGDETSLCAKLEELLGG